ncbi:proline dehydrogenase [Croceivirga lutea]|uniref:proline dehydrogenase family protein n=1 Tax=Croceivirga lutea TaxID=1775167 RepID=UPI001639D125|nr:proline dehydrogenase family protein [Croceivirga lutea]GGG44481.1 proline dehydrogenase [Croceivirga lutea]
MKRIFEDTATAFRLKSDSELERAYFLFKLIANQPLVRIGTAVTNFAINANLPVDGLIRATVFDHFCGGVNEEDCLPVIDKMYTQKVHSILDYSVEGKVIENQLDHAFEKILRVLDFVKEKEAIPFAVFKPTAFGRFELLEKKSNGEKLTTDEEAEWGRVVNRYDKVCKKAYDLEVSLLIDAEESWIQLAADELALDMMRKYNKVRPVVYNTAQLYRWDRLSFLVTLHEIAVKEGFKVGIKVVRGAYLEKENNRAEENGYTSPICKSKKATDDNFDDALRFMIEHTNVFTIFAGTHNENSSYLLIDLMKQRNMPNNHPNIWFGQLYGMSDNISYNLADQGYNVSKYLPYGPVRDVMPYLIRRAEENTSVAGQTTRELDLLKKERKRRKI